MTAEKQGQRLTGAQSTKANFNGIDIVKFICSILVFMIHVPAWPEDSFAFDFIISRFLSRIPVPFFFITSGFFLFRKMDFYELKTDVIKNYCYKSLMLLGLWKLLLLGNSSQLWYMGAIVVAITVVSLCFHFRMKVRNVYILAIALYIMGLLGDTYTFLMGPVKDITIAKYIFAGYRFFFNDMRNGVFFGFLFVLIGATLARCKIKMSTLTSFIGCVVFMVLFCLESFMIRKAQVPIQGHVYIFLVPAVLFLFIFASSVKLKDRPIYKRMRMWSTLVYFLHLLIYSIVKLMINAVRSVLGIELIDFRFVITLTLTLVLSIFIEWLSQKEKFKWINWLL